MGAHGIPHTVAGVFHLLPQGVNHLLNTGLFRTASYTLFQLDETINQVVNGFQTRQGEPLVLSPGRDPGDIFEVGINGLAGTDGKGYPSVSESGPQQLAGLEGCIIG
jgi:hypothetical protein